MRDEESLTEQHRNRNFLILISVFIFCSFFIWDTIDAKKENVKYKQCSRYTIGEVVRTKRWKFKTLLFYSFSFEGKKIENEDRPSPSSISEWWNLDYEKMKGQRIWIQFYCNDPKVHKVLWDLNVADTIKFVPENGWNKLPLTAQKNSK